MQQNAVRRWYFREELRKRSHQIDNNYNWRQWMCIAIITYPCGYRFALNCPHITNLICHLTLNFSYRRTPVGGLFVLSKTVIVSSNPTYPTLVPRQLTEICNFFSFFACCQNFRANRTVFWLTPLELFMANLRTINTLMVLRIVRTMI